MAGQIKQMVDKVIVTRSQGNATIAATTRTKLILKGINPDKFSPSSEDDPLVLDKPEPQVAVSELADSSVNFVVRPWCKTDDYWTLYFRIPQKIKEEFDKAGIEIPFPQQDVHLFKETA